MRTGTKLMRHLGIWGLLALTTAIMTHCGAGIHLGPYSAAGHLSLTSVSPTSGSKGLTLTLAGTGFTPDDTVTLGGAACGNINVISTAQITCTTPAHAAGAVDVQIQNRYQALSTLKAGFKYVYFLFVADSGTNNVAYFSVDPTTGNPTLGGVANGTLNGPHAMALAPSGRYLYVVDQGDISIFSVNAATGTLSFISSTSLGGQPKSLAISPSGAFVYVPQNSLNTVSILAIDPSSGILTSAGTANVGVGPDTISIHPNGNYAYLTNNLANTISTFSINPTSGALTPSGADISVGTSPRGVTINPAGSFLFVANSGSGFISSFQITGATGALAALPNTSTIAGLTTLAVDPTGQALYTAANPSSGGATVFSISASGGLTPTATLSTGVNPSAFAVDATASFLYITNAGSDSLTGFLLGQSPSTPTSPNATAMPTGSSPAAIVID